MNATTSKPPTQAIEALYAAAHWLFGQNRSQEAASVFRAMMLAAPTDERGWIGLGACHESLGEHGVAMEMYVFGTAAATPAPRCELARARLLRANGSIDEADMAIARAAEIAEERDDDELRAIVRGERGER